MSLPQPPQVIYLQRPPSNGVAITSLVTGILAILVAPMTLIPIFGLVMLLFAAPPTLMAVLFGHSGLRLSKRLGGTGGGSAIAGLVMGYISLALCLIPITLAIGVLASSSSS